MQRAHSFTQGPILPSLLRFTLPILAALALQAMYGAVDLLVVGQFGTAAGVSAVATGSQLLQTVTGVLAGMAVGATVLLAQKLGQGAAQEAGDVIGASICLFGCVAAAFTAGLLLAARPLARLLQAPPEALEQTTQYIAICACGAVFIVAYNVLGSIFRGMGDSKTPLFTVGVACVVNIGGDLLFVAGFGMGAAGAALATVLAQGVSVALCLWVVKRRGLPFVFTRDSVRFRGRIIKKLVGIGIPVALQDLLVSISFLVILGIVNGLGVVASAGVGVAEKLCAFIMLVPGAFMQALSAYVGQNIGAGQPQRARRALLCGMLSSLVLGVAMAWLSFFHGAMLAGIFAKDAAVIAAAADYLRAYAIDAVLVSFLFCYSGYFSGCGRTRFVMVQGILGAFGVRIPVSWAMSRLVPVSLFAIGLATPCSTVVQIVLCTVYFVRMLRKERAQTAGAGANAQNGL